MPASSNSESSCRERVTAPSPRCTSTRMRRDVDDLDLRRVRRALRPRDVLPYWRSDVFAGGATTAAVCADWRRRVRRGRDGGFPHGNRNRRLRSGCGRRTVDGCRVGAGRRLRAGSGAGPPAWAESGPRRAATAKRSGIQSRRSKAGERRVMCDHLGPGCFLPKAYACRRGRSTLRRGGSSVRTLPGFAMSCGLQPPPDGQGPVQGVAARERSVAPGRPNRRRRRCRRASATTVLLGCAWSAAENPNAAWQRPSRLAGNLDRQAAASTRAAGDRLPAVLRGRGVVARQGRRTGRVRLVHRAAAARAVDPHRRRVVRRAELRSEGCREGVLLRCGLLPERLDLEAAAGRRLRAVLPRRGAVQRRCPRRGGVRCDVVPSSPALPTLTGEAVFPELPPQPHGESRRTAGLPRGANAACSVSDFCPSTWMAVPLHPQPPAAVWLAFWVVPARLPATALEERRWTARPSRRCRCCHADRRGVVRCAVLQRQPTRRVRPGGGRVLRRDLDRDCPCQRTCDPCCVVDAALIAAACEPATFCCWTAPPFPPLPTRTGDASFDGSA